MKRSEGRAKCKSWTPEEKALLLLKFGTMTLQEVTLLFPGRSSMSVQARATQMKLTKGPKHIRKWSHPAVHSTGKRPASHPAIIQAETRRKKYAYDRTPCSERELGYDVG